MSAPAAKPWELLFPPPPAGAEAVALRFRLLRKQGRPLLLVPAGGDVVAASLTLYPAQSRKARFARKLAAAALKLGLPMPGESVAIPCARAHPFLRFLAGNEAKSSEARFAVFFCNPRPGGQRFVLLTFDSAGQPVRAVKAGAGPEAVAVIQRETSFLRSLGGELTAAPKVRGEFESPGVQAIALEFISGETPVAADFGHAGAILTQWLRPEAQSTLLEFPAWQQVRAVSGDPLIARLEQAMGATRFASAIHHGDFAPWNIRVDRATGQWRVLDWERGERRGPPGWDWFHLVLQWAILVERPAVADIATRLEAVLAGEEFTHYAHAAGIAQCAREMVLAYLLHAREVLRPTEGGALTAALLAHLQPRWLAR